MTACPWCGRDNPADPSTRPDGDHLVMQEGPLGVEVSTTIPDFRSNKVRVTTSQHVEFTWCSTIAR